MDSIFLFFFIGVAVYLAGAFSGKSNNKLRIILFLAAGCLAGAIIIAIPGILESTPGSPLVVPLLGMIAGYFLFRLEERKWIEKQGLQYFVTLFLGLLLGGIGFVLYKAEGLFSGRPPVYQRDSLFTFSYSFMAGFLMIFGYTFPARIFRKRPQSANEENLQP